MSGSRSSAQSTPQLTILMRAFMTLVVLKCACLTLVQGFKTFGNIRYTCRVQVFRSYLGCPTSRFKLVSCEIPHPLGQLSIRSIDTYQFSMMLAHHGQSFSRNFHLPRICVDYEGSWLCAWCSWLYVFQVAKEKTRHCTAVLFDM